MIKKGVIFILTGILFASILIILSSNYVLASECNDHIDNNNDGYCDVVTTNGYCEDGSILGDQNCIDSESLESSCSITNSGIEICDGIDNNCNGQVDENLVETQDCGLNIGECRYGTQTRTCEEGQWLSGTACIGGVIPEKEICGDEKDNNCNGLIDEDCLGINAQVIYPAQSQETPQTEQNQRQSAEENSQTQETPQKSSSTIENIKTKIQDKDFFTIFILVMIGALVVAEIGLAFYKKIILGI